MVQNSPVHATLIMVFCLFSGDRLVLPRQTSVLARTNLAICITAGLHSIQWVPGLRDEVYCTTKGKFFVIWAPSLNWYSCPEFARL